MTKEEQQLEKRFLELGEQAWQRGTAVYSDFLNLNELNIFQEVRPKLPHLETESFGGYELAERQIAVFRPEAPLFCTEPPIACLRITPLQEKFAEALTHRDYLGAVLNLGLQRSCLGDILVMKKPHPCGEKRWLVLRTGMDFRLRCMGCGHEVMLPRSKAEKSIRKVFRDGQAAEV